MDQIGDVASTAIIAGAKRKRGRPPKSQAAKKAEAAKMKGKEDLCFVCFDGGNLVGCDRGSGVVVKDS